MRLSDYADEQLSPTYPPQIGAAAPKLPRPSDYAFQGAGQEWRGRRAAWNVAEHARSPRDVGRRARRNCGYGGATPLAAPRWRHMLGGVGFVDAQVAELVAVVDALMAPPAATTEPGFNGSHGLVRNVVGEDAEFLGAASRSWQAVHEATNAQHARLSAGDEAVGSLLAAVHERAVQTRRQLASIRAELLDLHQGGTEDVSTRADKTEMVDLVQAKARELQKLTHEAQRFSGEMAGKLRAAAATYSGSTSA